MQIRILTFADAARPNERAQLGSISGLLIGPLKSNSIFHPLNWSSALSKSPVKSAGSGEILAAGIGADDGKLLADVFGRLLGICVEFVLGVDSKSLWDCISTCHEPHDKHIRPHVALLRYDFERAFITALVWIAGTKNPSDAVTKPHSSTIRLLQQILHSGRVTVDMSETEYRDQDRSLG